MTLKLTKENLLRIKETLVNFIHTHPLLSACAFVVSAAILVIIIMKYVKSTA